MNKSTKSFMAILGGIDTTVYMFTPIILAAIWVIISEPGDWRIGFFYGVGLLATLFRAIKIGWKDWLKDDY